MKILVAGVNTKQVIRLQNEFKDMDIITIDREKRLSNVPPNYSWYLIWAKFISHDQQEIIRKYAPKEKVKIVGGGIANIRSILASISKI